MADIKNIYNELISNNFIPVKFFSGGKAIDLVKKKNLGGIKLNKKRPFVVFEVRKESLDNGESFIYKKEIKDSGTFQSVQKEALIHEFILPRIYSKLPKNIREKVVFPKITQKIKKNGKIKAFVREKAEGVICGANAVTKRNILNKEDIEIITCVIKNFQSIKPDEFKNRAGVKLPERNFLESYKENLINHKKAVRALMGSEYVLKMDELLREAEKIIPREQLTLLSEDITSLNIIKTREGKLGFIDWERPYLGRNSAADYSRFIVRLWTVSALMREAIKIAIKINKENINFIKLLKISLVFTDGSHMLFHYYKKLKSKNIKEKEEALKGIKSLKKLLIDILDNKGAWKNNR